MLITNFYAVFIYSERDRISMTKSIVWLSIESLRYNRINKKDNNSGFGSNLQAIRRGSDVKTFSQCFSHSNWTRTSTTSILSGMYPSSHGVFHWNDKLSSNATSVPEILSEQGYTSIFIGKNSQIGTAIDAKKRFNDAFSITRNTVNEAVGVTGLLRYLVNLRVHGGGFTSDFTRHNSSYLTNLSLKRKIKSETEPMFIFVHYNDTHSPYIPPLSCLKEANESLPVSPDEAIKIIKDIFDKNERKYNLLGNYNDKLTNEEIKIITKFYELSVDYVEKMVASAIEYITSELNAIVVVTGDHGELFGEHDLFGHGISTHNAVTHVPLLIKGNTNLQKYDGLIQHIDIIHTLMKEQGITHTQLQGLDLRNDRREYSICERGRERSNTILRRIKKSQCANVIKKYPEGDLVDIQTDEFKYIRTDEYESLFELPDETTDVKEKYPDIVEEFKLEYENYTNKCYDKNKFSEKADLSKEAKQNLKNMGYLVE